MSQCRAVLAMPESPLPIKPVVADTQLPKTSMLTFGSVAFALRPEHMVYLATRLVVSWRAIKVRKKTGAWPSDRALKSWFARRMEDERISALKKAATATDCWRHDPARWNQEVVNVLFSWLLQAHRTLTTTGRVQVDRKLGVACERRASVGRPRLVDMEVEHAWQLRILGAKLRIYADKNGVPVLPGNEASAKQELLSSIHRLARMDGVSAAELLNRLVPDACAIQKPHILAFMPGGLGALKARLRRARKRKPASLPRR